MHTASTKFDSPYGRFSLNRYPARRQEPLQAWCAADSLLLEEAHRLGVGPGQCLVVNDDCGALALPLVPRAVWTDSALAARAIAQNLERNRCHPAAITWSTDQPDTTVRYVFMRVPKNQLYFSFQLALLARHLPSDALVVAGGMDKHLSVHTATVMERWLGPTTRHRGRAKARLFSARISGLAPATENFTTYYRCAGLPDELAALPNVFSASQMDIGSSFLIAQLSQLPAVDSLVDLACGNGVLGLHAYQAGLAKQVLFCDESAMALQSAGDNARRLYPATTGHFDFLHGDGLADYAGSAVDLILCNPPFHAGNTVDDFAGRHLLNQCAAKLSSTGQLCVVANRHLDSYVRLLRRSFSRVETIAQNSKFRVYLASHPGR